MHIFWVWKNRFCSEFSYCKSIILYVDTNW